MQDNKKIASNTFYLYLRLILAMIISLYTIRVVMSELGVEGLGTFNVVAGFVSMLGFVGTTMITGIQRFLNYEIGRRGESAITGIYSASIKIQAIIAFTLCVILETAGLWYVNDVMKLPYDRMAEINWLYQFAIATLIINIMTVPFNALVISKEHMGFYALLSVLENVAKLFIAFSLSCFGNYRLAVYGGLLMTVTALSLLSYYLFCKHIFKVIKYRRESHKGLVKPILEFSVWNNVGAFANICRGQGANILLNYFFGVAINAANAIVTQIYSAVQLFALNICMAFRPQLTEAYAQNNFIRTRSMFYAMSRSTFAMVYTVCIPLFLELPYILNVWLGNNIPEFTEQFTLITLLTVLVGSVNTPVSTVIYANGRIKQYMLVYSSVCLCIPLGWLCFRLGAPASSIFWITLALMMAIQFVSLAMLKHYLPYSYSGYFRKVVSPIVVFSVLTPVLPLITRLIMPEGLLRFVLVVIFSILTCSFMALYVIADNATRIIIIERLKNSKQIKR